LRKAAFADLRDPGARARMFSESIDERRAPSCTALSGISTLCASASCRSVSLSILSSTLTALSQQVKSRQVKS